ncbi:flavin reductase family protein (plasmid) [Pseudonocardia bannensis]|uniref:Flavin reductase family protein n=1 Tax=Pseudonocardia bannensis TaxID=630973 RepID=A0A848DRW1_9PSEU|nr:MULTISPECIES: flavin reductase family protein [Pseudonocardia]NMH95156.1 flavin reductase family protein [Pseudonocardia bannensis]
MSASEPEPFHAAVGQLDYPMIIVTAAAGGERSGCLVGFHTQCSIDPARFLVCLSSRNRTCAVATRSDRLAVHFLDENDYELSSLFGEQTGDEVDKFAACDWQEEHGVPVLTGTRAWFVGRVLERVPFGDHVGHLLEPLDGRVGERLRQLAFQRVKTMKPGHPA